MSWRTVLRSRIFDAVHNVETTKPMLLQDLTIQGSNREHGVLYEPTDMGVAREVLAALPLRDHNRFTFLDYGSGKGRMLMLASRYPFMEIIGIEFTSELHEIAQKNLQRFFGWGKTQCRKVRSCLADATTFPIPPVPLVVYLFNPFHAPVVEQVWRNLEQSNTETPRDVYIVAVSWARRHFENKPVETVHRNPSFNIYRMHPTS
jgi:SAM-dependent methyltransferase